MSFSRQVLGTLIVRILLIPSGVVYSVVLARWLGPTDLGVFAAIGAVLGMASQFGNLGLPTAVTRVAAAEPDRVPALLANARWTGAVVGAAALVALAGVHRLAASTFGEVPLSLVLLAALALPLNFAGAQFQAVLLGLRRIRHYNLMEALNRVLLLAASVLVLVVLPLGLRALVLATVVLAVMHYAAYHVLLWPQCRRLRPDPALLRGMGGFSSRAYVTCLLSFLILRSDILLINALIDAGQTGVYSIAVRSADYLLLLPVVAGGLLLPRVAGQKGPDDDATFTTAVVRHTNLIMISNCVLAAATAWWLIPAVFGDEYRGAVAALWMLLPGVWCMAMQSILANDLAARDYPLVLPGVGLVVLVVNVTLNVFWIPRFGIVGAAASSTIAYALSLLLIAAYWLRRFRRIKPAALLLLRREELRALAGRVWRALRPGVAQTGAPAP